jgi:hypothetical protein
MLLDPSLSVVHDAQDAGALQQSVSDQHRAYIKNTKKNITCFWATVAGRALVTAGRAPAAAVLSA